MNMKGPKRIGTWYVTVTRYGIAVEQGFKFAIITWRPLDGLYVAPGDKHNVFTRIAKRLHERRVRRVTGGRA